MKDGFPSNLISLIFILRLRQTRILATPPDDEIIDEKLAVGDKAQDHACDQGEMFQIQSHGE